MQFVIVGVPLSMKIAPPFLLLAVLFVIVQFEALSAQTFQSFCHFLVFDGEVEFVGLNRVGLRTFEAGLDETTFVGLEEVAFQDDLIEFATFDARSEHKVVAIIYDSCQSEDNNEN